MLSYEEARRVYDRVGSFQDSQAFYEDTVTEVLLKRGAFETAEAVFEFGSGTGRLAERLFRTRLPATARYRGVDVSPTMVGLARTRIAPWASRAEVVLTDGRPPVDEPEGAYDRFLSTFVFDLLSEQDIRAVLAEAHRILRPGGLLCLASLSTGTGPLSRATAGVWGWLARARPSLVGGCRPIDLLPFLEGTEWKVRHQEKVVTWGIPSEAVVAER